MDARDVWVRVHGGCSCVHMLRVQRPDVRKWLLQVDWPSDYEALTDEEVRSLMATTVLGVDGDGSVGCTCGITCTLVCGVCECVRVFWDWGF